MGQSVIFQGSKLKALKKEIQLGTGASRISGTVDPTSSAVSAVAGSLYQNETTGKVYRKLDAGSSTNWVEVKEGGVKNYIENGDAVLDTSGWSVYKDAAGSKPVDGTGQISAPTLTWTRTTSSPLSGVASFLATNSGANCQGEGISYDFTVDRSDEGSILTCPLAFQPRTGTYSGGTSTTDSDLTIYIVSKEFGTVIQPSYYKLQGAVNNTAYKSVPVFQVPVSAGGANAREFRLCIHVATTNSSAWTVAFDEIGVTPISQGIVPIESDWKNVTSDVTVSSGFGTVTNKEIFMRRVGDSMLIKGTFRSGTVTGTSAYIDLPFSLQADGNKMNWGIAFAAVGRWQTSTFATAAFSIDGSLANIQGMCTMYDSNPGRLVFAFRGTGYGFENPGVGSIMAGGEAISFEAVIPIKGWGSSVAVSPDDTSGRFISSSYYHTTGSTYSAGNIIDFNSKRWDDNAAVTTGASWKYTAKEPGQYDVYVDLQSSSFSATAGDRYVLELYKNGVFEASSGRMFVEVTASQIRGLLGNFSVRLEAGDYFDIRMSTNASFGPLSAVSGYSVITVTKVEGRTQVGPGELIYAKYVGNGGTSITANVTNIDFSNKVYDSHGCWSGLVFTASAPGLYTFLGCVNSSTGNSAFFSLYKNGTIIDGALMNGVNTSTDNKGIHGEVWLDTGDTASVRSDTSLTLSNSTANHWISIKRST